MAETRRSSTLRPSCGSDGRPSISTGLGILRSSSAASSAAYRPRAASLPSAPPLPSHSPRTPPTPHTAHTPYTPQPHLPHLPPPSAGYLRRSRSRKLEGVPEKRGSWPAAELLQSVSSGAQRISGSVATGAGLVGSSVVHTKQRLEDSIDKSIEDRVDWVLSMVGGRVGRMLVDPFMPIRLQQSIRSVWGRFWPDVATSVRNDFMVSYGLRNKSARKVHLEEWPPAPPLWPPTYNAYRARILYAVLPADVGIWQLLQKPSTYPVLLLLFFPFASVSTITWVCLLLLIDKNDEYQLANYILVFRAALFVSVGLYWSIKGFVLLYLCTSKVGGDCMQQGPGVSDTQTLKLAMTMARMVCGWIAFVLLVRNRVQEQRAMQVSVASALVRPRVLPLRGSGEESAHASLTGTGHRKSAVTRAERWAAVGAAIGMVIGFATGLIGTTLLFLGFSLTGHVHIQERHWTDTLLPVSLLPSVNAIIGTVFGFSIAMTLEWCDKRRARREALQVIDAEQKPDPQDEGVMHKLKGVGGCLEHSIRSPRHIRRPTLLVSKEQKRFDATLRRAFNAVDVDRSGFLSQQEVARTLSICGIKATPAEVQTVLEEFDTDHSGGLDFDEFRRLGARLRDRFRVPVVNAMTKLLLYEAISFSLVVLVVILNGYINIGPQSMWEVSPNIIMYTINVLLYGPADPMVRLTLYFGLAIGCLISFLPFVVFKLPLIGPALLKLKPTGYDQAGNVRPTLTKAQKAAKYRLEDRQLKREQAASQQEPKHDSRRDPKSRASRSLSAQPTPPAPRRRNFSIDSSAGD